MKQKKALKDKKQLGKQMNRNFINTGSRLMKINEHITAAITSPVSS
jgi:hypothetical protein